MELTLRARIASAALMGLLSLAVGVPLAAAQTDNLHLRLSGSPRSVFVDQQVTYTATVANHRDAAIGQAMLRDRLPGAGVAGVGDGVAGELRERVAGRVRPGVAGGGGLGDGDHHRCGQ